MVSAAVPYMQGTLGASADDGPWLQISYNALYYLLLIATPWMISRFGRRAVWIGGHATYAIASIGCATSGNFVVETLWRALQGAGQGTFFICAVMTILRVFPPKIAFVGFAIFATTSLAGPAAGPAVGGWFVDEHSWRGLFLMLAAFAALASAIVARVLRDPPESRAAQIDPLGLAFAFLHLLTYHYLTQFGERRDWLGSRDIVYVGAVFVAATGAFIWWELAGTDHPFIKLRLFQDHHNLRWGAFLGFVLGVPLFGASIFLQYLEAEIAFTPSLAGGLLATRIAAIVIFAPVIAYVLSKRLFDPRYLIVTGFVLVSISYWLQWYGTTATADFGTFVLSVVLSGAAFALLFSPIASTILLSLPPEDFTRGVAIFKITLTTGGSFAAAVLGVIVDRRTAAHYSDLSGNLTLASVAVARFLQSGNRQTLGALLTQQSQVLAYADTALYTAILVLFVAPLAFILRPPKPQGAGG